MEIRVGEQALALALALLLGLGTGLLYDMLRPLRRRGGKPLAARFWRAFTNYLGIALDFGEII